MATLYYQMLTGVFFYDKNLYNIIHKDTKHNMYNLMMDVVSIVEIVDIS